jgi:Uma2 family endonuclease
MGTVSPPIARGSAASIQRGGVSVITDRYNLDIPASAFSIAGFRAWATADDFPERVRVTFINGEIILDMSNEELETHNTVRAEFTRVLATMNHEHDQGEFYTAGVLVSNEAAEVSNNPDAVFLTWQTLEGGRATLVPREGMAEQYIEVEGTPDWVLEVVSDSSVQKDTRRLREAYHRAGIPEYWLVDARGEEIAFQVLQSRRSGYAAAPSRDGWQRSRVFARSFRLERTRGRGGFWRYTLHVRAE